MHMERFINMKVLEVFTEAFGYLLFKLLVVISFLHGAKHLLYDIFLGVFYITTYEGVRHILNKKNVHSNIRALIAGGTASLVGQTIIVPFDVLSQHLMMMGVNGKDEKVKTNL